MAPKRYEGMNYVFCGGRVVLGPQYTVFMATIVLVTIPTAMGYSVMYDNIGACVTLAISYTLSLFFLVRISIMDPGIVERNPPLDPHAHNPPVEVAAVTEKGIRVVLRYCHTCCMYRGPRTHHCSVCDNCVDGFDHHCPWTGTCIGYRNYASFMKFLYSLNLHFFVMMVLSAYSVVDRSVSDRVGIIDAAKSLHFLPFVIIAYGLLCGISMTGLTFYHNFLVVNGITTHEHLRGAYLKKPNIFDRGAKNWQRAFGWHDPTVFSRALQDRIVASSPTKGHGSPRGSAPPNAPPPKERPLSPMQYGQYQHTH